MNQNTFCKNCHRIPSQCCCPPVKELTSLEIADEMELVFGEQIEEQFGNDLEEFARAILRKAQEK